MDDNSSGLFSLLALVPLTVLIFLLFLSIRIFGSDALEGSSQIVLLVATAVCVAIAILIYKVPWKTLEAAMVNNITCVATALIILLIIGALSGSWMISGIIPTFIYYGIQIIHPDYFLVSTCVICSVISVMTGSSWTTIATIGIALLGIGQAQGFSPGWVAGAIISGSYFGDKVSPLSETTILASSVTEVPLFMHIRYLLITTVPSMVIALIIFLIAGFAHTTQSSGEIAGFALSLKQTFHITPWVLLVPVFTGIMIARRVPSIITLFLSVLMAGIMALIFQPHILHSISGLEFSSLGSLFKGLVISWYGATSVETGNGALNDLVSTNGMAGMLNTIWLIICAMCFGGAMSGSGMLQRITAVFIRFMKNTGSMVASTVFSGILLNLTTADQYISIILTGNMFKDVYQSKGYETRLLSRAVEDGVTVTSPLIPWNTCGMTQATILGVSTFSYLPYCFFNLLSPVMSIIIAMLGFKIYRTDEKDQSVTAG